MSTTHFSSVEQNLCSHGWMQRKLLRWVVTSLYMQNFTNADQTLRQASLFVSYWYGAGMGRTHFKVYKVSLQQEYFLELQQLYSRKQMHQTNINYNTKMLLLPLPKFQSNRGAKAILLISLEYKFTDKTALMGKQLRCTQRGKTQTIAGANRNNRLTTAAGRHGRQTSR